MNTLAHKPPSGATKKAHPQYRSLRYSTNSLLTTQYLGADVGNPTSQAVREKQGYERARSITNHLIMDQMTDVMMNRRAIHKASGDVLPYVLIPQTKELMRSEWGLTPLEIAQSEAEILDSIEANTAWRVERDIPKSVLAWNPSLRAHAFKSSQEEDIFFDNRIVAVPGWLENATLCAHLLTLFSESELLSCPGFVKKRYEDEEGICYAVRLDVDANLSRKGFMVPVVRAGWIVAMRVFRHPKDERPFILRSRTRELALDV